MLDSQAQRQAMVDHFKKTAQGDDPEHQAKLRGLLNAGKDNVRRPPNYDENYHKDKESPP